MKKLLIFLLLPVPMVFALLISSVDKNEISKTNINSILTSISKIKKKSKFLNSFVKLKNDDNIVYWDGMYQPTEDQIINKIDSYGNDSLRIIEIVVKRNGNLFKYKIPNS